MGAMWDKMKGFSGRGLRVRRGSFEQLCADEESPWEIRGPHVACSRRYLRGRALEPLMIRV